MKREEMRKSMEKGNTIEKAESAEIRAQRLIKFKAMNLLGIGCAFIGWIVENVTRLIAKGVVDSRFHILPFIPEYALIPFAFFLLLGSTDDLAVFGKRIFKKRSKGTRILSNILCLFVICLLVFLGEQIVGTVYEKLFGVELWNYESQPLHFTKYTSTLSVFGYGLGVWLLFKFALTPLYGVLQKVVVNRVVSGIMWAVSALMAVDALILFVQIAAFGNLPVYWAIYF